MFEAAGIEELAEEKRDLGMCIPRRFLVGSPLRLELAFEIGHHV